MRLLNVTATNLIGADEPVPAQLSLLDEVVPDDPRQAALEAAVDRLRSRFGHAAVKPGTPEV